MRIATLSFLKPRTTLLDVKHPSLLLTVRASAPTSLTIKLVDGKGHIVANWSKHPRKGSNSYKLALPPAARHAGHHALRITEAGKRAPITLQVTLAAA